MSCNVTSSPFIPKGNFQIIKESYYIATAINLAEVIEDLTILKILAFSLNLPLSLGIILVMYTFCFILRPWKTHAVMNKPQKKLSDY